MSEQSKLMSRRLATAAVAVLLLSAGVAPGHARGTGRQISPEVYGELEYRHIGPTGNRVIAVTGVPGDPDVYYAGAPSGGVFKTSDGGSTWQPIFDDQEVSSVGSLAVAPSSPNIVWAGTGETFLRSNNSVGNGIYKSTDGGRSWQLMGLEKTGRIGRIVIHPDDPDIVFAAAMGHCYGPQPERGVFRTTDGGKSWERVLFVDENTGASDIAMDPNNPDILFAGTWQVEVKTWLRESGGPGSGLFRSKDGGTTWERLSGNGLPATPLGKVGVSVAPGNSNRIYALLETGDGVPWHGRETSVGVLWTSKDGGDSWELISRDRSLAGRANYYTRSVVAPDDENEIYFLAASFGISLDGGRTTIDLTPGMRPGGDNHDMWIDPTDGDRMIVGNDGPGVAISVNRGRSWRGISLNNAQMYHVAVDNQIPYYVYGNRQDGPSQRGPSNSRLGSGLIPRGMWHSVGGSESGFAIPDPVDNNIVWSGGYPGGPLDRFDQRTRQTRAVDVWPNDLWGTPAADLKYRFQWTFPIAISPHDHNRVYVGSQYVHQTTNGGHSWTTISPDLSLNDKEMQQISGGLNPENASIEYGNVIFAIAESPVEAGLIWAGTNDGLVQVTRNGGSSWTNVTANFPDLPPFGTVSNIEPSRYDAGRAYVTLDLHQVNDRAPHVYKTTDYGRTWTSITSGIPHSMLSYAHCIREDPVRRGLLYLGTENALYVSFNDGESWQPLQNNLPPAPVHWLEVQDHFNDLVVATYGRGFWILDDLTPLQQLTPQVLDAEAYLLAPRPAYRFRNITSPMSQRGDTVGGQNPPYGAAINYYLKSASDGPVGITILDENDRVVRTLEGSANPGINRIWWDLRSDPTKEVRLRTSPLYAPYVGGGPEGWRPLPVRGGGRTSILEPPGTYSVKLTVGEAELTRRLTVIKDPHSAGSGDDIVAQMALLRDIRDSVESTAGLINQLEWIRKQIADVAALLESDETSASLIAAGERLDGELIELEEHLFQMKLTGRGQDMARWPARLIAKLTTLANRVGGSDFPPTTQQIERAGELREQVATYRSELRDLIDGDLDALNARLKAEDIPHILVVEGS